MIFNFKNYVKNRLIFFESYFIKLLPNLSQTLPVIPLPIKGVNINSNSFEGIIGYSFFLTNNAALTTAIKYELRDE